MADKELKPVSFRIDDDTKEKIKEISEDLGINQHGTIQKLIEAFEIQKGKSIIIGENQQGYLADFEYHTSQMNQKFLLMIQGLQDAEAKAEAKVLKDIQSQKESIINLQEQLTVAKQLKEDATAKAKALTDENLNLTNRIAKSEKELEDSKDNYESILSDKDSLNKALTTNVNTLNQKIDGIEGEYHELKEKSKLLDRITVEHDSLAKDNEHLKELLQEQLKHETDALEQAKIHEAETVDSLKQKLELNQEKALLDLERKHQEQIMQLKDDKQKEIDKYQQRYYELLERMNSKEESLPDE